MPAVSVITPFHRRNLKFLLDAYESLLEQDFGDWEWVLVPNGEAIDVDLSNFSDSRVRVYPFEYGAGRVGALKRYACSRAVSPIIVELDWDDILTPNCLSEVVRAFRQNPGICFVYSNMAQTDVDLVPYGNWDPSYGPGRRPFTYKGKELVEAVFESEDSQPHDMLRTWYAPNHVRAWLAEVYWKVGGHDAEMVFSDDHDLMARLFLHGPFLHIDKCLYIYRVHDGSATTALRADIEATRWDMYDRYVYPLVERWADVQGLKKINLLPEYWPWEGYEGVDVESEKPWPLADNSVGVIRAHDAIHHLKNPIHVMNEAYRVLAHGGFFMILTPSTDGSAAFSDPDTKSYWNENSFWYYTRKSHSKYINSACRFQILRLRTFPLSLRNDLPYTQSNLICIKNDYPKFSGGLEI